MSDRESSRIPRGVALALVVFTAWPMAHLVLTAVMGSDAWKLGGFGMYATPRPRVRLGLEVDVGQGLRPYNPTTLEGPLQREFSRTQESMAILGAWTSPESFARLLLDRYPKIRTVEIIADRTSMDTERATLVTETRRFTYGR